MVTDLASEHLAFRKVLRSFAEKEIRPRAAQADQSGTYPEDMFNAMRTAGLLGLCIPQELGGSGGGMTALCLAIEEVCRYCNSAGLMLLLTRLATGPLLLSSNHTLRDQYLPEVASGRLRGSFCLTELHAGSDVNQIATSARPHGHGFVLNGTKAYISGATVADFFIVWAKTQTAAGADEMAAFLVDRDTEGLALGHIDEKMGVRAVPTAEVVLSDCYVPSDHRISDSEGGMRHLMASLNSARPGVAARGLGLAEGALAYACEYARNRTAFGTAVIDIPAVQQMIADITIGIEAARGLVHRAAQMVDRGEYGLEAAGMMAIAKCFATDLAVRASSDCLQILGAAGYMSDHPMERFYRDAKQLQIVEGTNQIQRVIIARAVRDGRLTFAD